MNKKYQFIRHFVQLFFVFLCFQIGYQFYGFVKYCETAGTVPFIERPPGVEAFLPISSLISLKYFFLTGEINRIHPAGLMLFAAFIVISLILKKAFCGWICPIGFLSEYLWKSGKKIFGNNISIPVWGDSILRSLKYLLLGFFLWAILIQMDYDSIKHFIYSPYNKVADVKMLNFFTEISNLTTAVLLLLFILSMIFKNFWCRYLCPYGALLGIVSLLSPFKISRTAVSCIDCKKCTNVCPALIKVHEKKKVISDECMACLACVEKCPVENTLDFRLSGSRITLSAYTACIVLLLIYFSFWGGAKLTGYWNNSVSLNEYIERIQDIDNPLYNHNRGNVANSE